MYEELFTYNLHLNICFLIHSSMYISRAILDFYDYPVNDDASA
jgi:hypothetical protein